jgi:hypothetical protein
VPDTAPCSDVITVILTCAGSPCLPSLPAMTLHWLGTPGCATLPETTHPSRLTCRPRTLFEWCQKSHRRLCTLEIAVCLHRAALERSCNPRQFARHGFVRAPTLAISQTTKIRTHRATDKDVQRAIKRQQQRQSSDGGYPLPVLPRPGSSAW